MLEAIKITRYCVKTGKELKKQEAIKMLSNGETYDDISKALNVNKATLKLWEKQFRRAAKTMNDFGVKKVKF